MHAILGLTCRTLQRDFVCLLLASSMAHNQCLFTAYSTLLFIVPLYRGAWQNPRLRMIAVRSRTSSRDPPLKPSS